jgi:hypothetical protein
VRAPPDPPPVVVPETAVAVTLLLFVAAGAAEPRDPPQFVQKFSPGWFSKPQKGHFIITCLLHSISILTYFAGFPWNYNAYVYTYVSTAGKYHLPFSYRKKRPSRAGSILICPAEST